MEMASVVQKRSNRLANIRQNLSTNPLLQGNKARLNDKLEKNRARRSSIQYDKQICTSASFEDLIELQSDNASAFQSLFNDKYQIGQKKGEGAHGVVRKCYHKKTGNQYAVKTITLDREHILYLKQNFTDIKSLDHPNIPKYHEMFFQRKNSTCHLVMDYVAFPDLLEVEIRSQNQLKEIVHQILKTLQYIHQKSICHRDIKPENILYDKKSKVVSIIDFGVSKKLTDRGRKRDMLTLTGTPYYRAPEMFQGGGYDEMVDMWALGVTIYKLMTKSTPFQSQYHSDTINNILKAQFTFPKNMKIDFSQSCKNLVRRLIKKDRKQRLTAQQALKDVWFYDLHKDSEAYNEDLMRSVPLSRGFRFNLSQSMRMNTSSHPTSQKELKQKENESPAIKSLATMFDTGECYIFGIEESIEKQI